MTKMLQDRDRTMQDLKSLVHDPSLFAKEVPHIQDAIQSNCWIFGEEYNLVVAEDSGFDKALRQYRGKVGLTGKAKKIENDDSARQVDVFATRRHMVEARDDESYFENIIIELKAPDVKLGKDELDQVEKYMRLIKNEAQFNSSKAKWTFILVGNELKKARGERTAYIQDKIDSNREHGKDIAIYDKNNDYVIKVKTWSTVFDEFQIRHDFIYSKLQFERDQEVGVAMTAEEAVDRINCRDIANTPQKNQISNRVKKSQALVKVS
jgi:hypothetical protein